MKSSVQHPLQTTMEPVISSSTSVLVQNTAPSIDGFSITPGTNVEANTTLEMIQRIRSGQRHPLHSVQLAQWIWTEFG